LPDPEDPGDGSAGSSTTWKPALPSLSSTRWPRNGIGDSGRSVLRITPVTPMKKTSEAARKTKTPAEEETFVVLDLSHGGTSDAATDGLAPVDLRERILARAHEIYLARNGGNGDALSDWLQAEREIGSSER